MVKIEQLGDGAYRIPGKTVIGMVCLDKDCYLIDTGLDDDQGRKALNAVRSLNCELKAVINTHSHADHIGGNSFVEKRTNVEIFGPLEEVPYIRNPVLEPVMLYGGNPVPELLSKFFMAKPSSAKPFENVSLPFKLVDLRGHSPGMVGIQTDQVFFVADAYTSIDLLRKHVIPYTYDPKLALRTLESMLDTKGLISVPFHGEPSMKPEEEIEANISAIQKTRETLLEVLKDNLSTCELISKVLSKLDVKIVNTALYFLYESALKGYLAWLKQEGLIISKVESHKVIWMLNKA